MDHESQKQFFQKAYDLKDKRIAAGYGWPLEVDEQLVRFLEIIKKSAPTGKALDLGCGQGRHTIFFAQNGFEAYGVDYIESVIDEARQEAAKNNIKNVYFEVMDVRELNFPQDHFDVVLDWSVLDHIKPIDWGTYAQNIGRILKKDGFLILTEFSANDQRIKDKTKNVVERENYYDHYFRQDEIENLFGESFQVIAQNETILTSEHPHLMLNVLLKKY